MKKSPFGFLLSILFGLFATDSIAHHSFSATFDQDATNTIEGVVTDFVFRNPHVLIYLDVTDEDGVVTNWMAEGSSATGWRRAGWAPDSLREGEVLRVTGNATLDGSPMVSVEEMVLLDPVTNRVVAELSRHEDPEVSRGGTTVAESERKLTFLDPTLPTGEPNFTGITMQEGAIDPRPSGNGPDANDQDMPYNAVGAAMNAAWTIVDDPQVFCDLPGVVRQAGYTPYGMKIRQYPNHVTIEYEEYGSRRSIFFDDELPKPGARSRLGDSVARYEGGNLVIETVNLLPNFSGHRGKPLSENARVTEVYSRADNPDYGTVLRIDTTVIDPAYLTEPWTITRYKLYSDSYEYIENECVPPLRERPEEAYQYNEFDLQFVQ